MHNTVAVAISSLATSRDSRHKPSKAKAATSSMEVLVTAGVNALNFHQNASQIMTSGGWALESVVCGMSEPVSSRSRAAGM